MIEGTVRTERPRRIVAPQMAPAADAAALDAAQLRASEPTLLRAQHVAFGSDPGSTNAARGVDELRRAQAAHVRDNPIWIGDDGRRFHAAYDAKTGVLTLDRASDPGGTIASAPRLTIDPDEPAPWARSRRLQQVWRDEPGAIAAAAHPVGALADLDARSSTRIVRAADGTTTTTVVTDIDTTAASATERRIEVRTADAARRDVAAERVRLASAPAADGVVVTTWSRERQVGAAIASSELERSATLGQERWSERIDRRYDAGHRSKQWRDLERVEVGAEQVTLRHRDETSYSSGRPTRTDVIRDVTTGAGDGAQHRDRRFTIHFDGAGNPIRSESIGASGYDPLDSVVNTALGKRGPQLQAGFGPVNSTAGTDGNFAAASDPGVTLTEDGVGVFLEGARPFGDDASATRIDSTRLAIRGLPAPFREGLRNVVERRSLAPAGDPVATDKLSSGMAYAWASADGVTFWNGNPIDERTLGHEAAHASQAARPGGPSVEQWKQIIEADRGVGAVVKLANEPRRRNIVPGPQVSPLEPAHLGISSYAERTLVANESNIAEDFADSANAYRMSLQHGGLYQYREGDSKTTGIRTVRFEHLYPNRAAFLERFYELSKVTPQAPAPPWQDSPPSTYVTPLGREFRS